MTRALKHWIRFLPDGGGDLADDAAGMEARIKIESALHEQRKLLERQLADINAQILAFGKETDSENARLTAEAAKVFPLHLVNYAMDCAYWQEKRKPQTEETQEVVE
jgi:hypothetical protein